MIISVFDKSTLGDKRCSDYSSINENHYEGRDNLVEVSQGQ